MTKNNILKLNFGEFYDNFYAENREGNGVTL